MLTAIDPSSSEPIRDLPEADAAETGRILERAVAARTAWAGASLDHRAEQLRAVARQIRADAGILGPLMTEEMGKPVREARGEVEKAAWCAEHYAEHAAAYLATQTLASDASHSYVQHLPLGTVLGILPWNAPVWLALRFGAPALMAGNTIIIKHDPHVPGTAAAIAETFRRAGAPEGLMQNLPLATPAVEAVIRDPRISAVSFTGSERGGAAVAAIAASELKPAVLELGGSDPAIVLADADLDEAAEKIRTMRIINAGQSCIAAKRIIVEAPIYEAMRERLERQFAALRVGDPRLEDTDVGPLARGDLRDNLHRQVSESIAAGANCRLGGELPSGPGYFYPVTFLTEVTPTMSVFREETFGPVAVLIRAEDAEQAIALANDTPYGLAASVWTSRERGEQIARRIEAGQVAVNGLVKTDPRLPSGGIKRSGYGRELGPHGILEFVNAQQVWVGPVQA